MDRRIFGYLSDSLGIFVPSLAVVAKSQGGELAVHYGNETLTQQARLFASAAVVIGPQGAGMGNLV